MAVEGETCHAGVGEALSTRMWCRQHAFNTNVYLMLFPSLQARFSDSCWSHLYILRDPSFLFSFQQKQVLCHLPLPLHEWPIAPWPHVQLVKV